MTITKLEIAKALSTEFIFFQNLVINPALVESWHLHFRNCTKDEFATALHLAVAEAKGWPPSPAHVWEMLDTLKTDPNEIETCEQSWYKVINNYNPSEKALGIFKTIPDFRDSKKWDSKTAGFRKRDFEIMWKSEDKINRIVEKQKIARQELGFNGLTLIANDLIKALSK